jgi:hypothetical protein
MNNNKPFLCLLTLLLSLSLSAQQSDLGNEGSSQPAPSSTQLQHELSLYAMGIHIPWSEYTNVGGGVSYTIFPLKWFGVSIAAEYTSTSLHVPLADFEVDIDGVYYYNSRIESMDFHTVAQGLAANATAAYVHLPLMLHFQTLGANKFSAAVGVRWGFAPRGSYTVSADRIRSSGTFASSGQTFTDMPNHGFVTISKPKVSDALALTSSAALAAELGGRWQLSHNTAFYIGLYVDYGLSNIAPSTIDVSLEIVQEHLPDEFKNDAELMANIPKRTTVALPSVHLVEAGLKVRWTWEWSASSKNRSQSVDSPFK